MFLSRYKFKGTWRKYQAQILDELHNHFKDKKINIVAAPGSGKTILGLEIVRRLDENVLILTPTITIKNQWVERFKGMFVPDEEQVDWISKDIYKLNRFNVVTYQALHYALHKKLIDEEEIDLNEEEKEQKVKSENIEYNLLKELENKKIKTIVLDEAHHLRAEWWKSLKYTLEHLQDITIVSLTATPPYDVEEGEWKRYEEICGTIDAEISTPELVATGDLCPHQDYVMFSNATDDEQNEIRKIKSGINDFIANLKKNTDFIKMLRSNIVINEWQIRQEQILSDVEYYGSIIIFLNSVGVQIDKRLVKFLTNHTSIPMFNKAWAEILLKNVLYNDNGSYENYKATLDDIKTQLNRLGCIEKRNVSLIDVKSVKRLIAGSVAKIGSIKQIVKSEHESLGDELRLVILADYVRQEYIDYDIKDINKLGVIPIFRHLLEQNLCNNIAVLTGKFKIIPKTLIPWLEEKLTNFGIQSKEIFKEFKIDQRYVIVKANKKTEDFIVKLVTESMEEKRVNIIVGTVALLGEGWDAPSVNSLVLSSFVGSFMLSNQMRGRAIRANKNMLNKTANIWHLACLAKISSNEYDYSDYLTLERRFKSFVGIANKQDTIQDGIVRLGFNNITAIAKNPDIANNNTIKLSKDRALMAERWKQILQKLGGTNIKMVKEVTTNAHIESKTFVTIDVTKMLVKMIGLNFILLFLAGLLARHTGISALPSFLSFGIALAGYYVIKIVRHINPKIMMNRIGEAVLRTMVRTNKIKTKELLVSTNTNKIIVEGLPYYSTCLHGASVYENNLYTECIKEIYSKVFDNRYLICVGKKNILSSKTYFNVPSIFDGDKQTATIFAEEWNKKVIKGTLIYTRNVEGRKILLKSRQNSINNTITFYESMKADFFNPKVHANWK